MSEKPELESEFAHLLNKAVYFELLSEEKKGFGVEPRSILIAFLTSEDRFSIWLRDYIISLDYYEILSSIQIDESELEYYKKRYLESEQNEEVISKLESHRNVFQTEVIDFNVRVIGEDNLRGLQPHHLFAYFIFNLTLVEEWSRKNILDINNFLDSFLDQIKQHASNEYDIWSKYIEENIVQQPSTTPSPVESIGPSTRITRDLWTIDDQLGYKAYAYAIYQFIIHKDTKPPLTISVQAPWGGGKTSLMRMIEDFLKPEIDVNVTESVGDKNLIDTDEQEPIKMKWLKKNPREAIEKLKPDLEIPQYKDNPNKRVTIWFNAWKCEGTEQVWAGLAHEIIKQYSERLPEKERNSFWLLLNLSRIDYDKIRNTISKRAISIVLNKITPWLIRYGGALILSIIISIVGWIYNRAELQNLAFATAGLSIVLSSLQTFYHYYTTMNAEVDFQLDDYLQIPDYSAKLGFVHQVEADLDRVFKVISIDRPLVVFIDDLDRCSPDKVAEVIEAINLFLADDDWNCIFVMGMDTDIVAAALEEAHSEVISKLSEDARSTPIGRRFMDKFVQLPFIIPPPEKVDIIRYSVNLLSEIDETPIENDTRRSIEQETENLTDLAEVPELVQKFSEQHEIGENQRSNLEWFLSQRVKLNQLSQELPKFSDRDIGTREQLVEIIEKYFTNPREIKRFLNMFRLHFFLKRARERDERETPSKEQLQRWLILYLKWPEVIRWVSPTYIGRGRGLPETPSDSLTAIRLSSLENIGIQCSEKEITEEIRNGGGTPDPKTVKEKQLEKWITEVCVVLQQEDSKNTPWVTDEDLMKFFIEEGTLPEIQRLSSATGKGFW